MRGTVILIAGVLLGASAALWVWGQPGPDAEPSHAAPPSSTVRSAPLTAPVVPVDLPPVPTAAPVAAARMAMNRYLSEEHLLETFDALRKQPSGAALLVAGRIEQDCFLDTRTEFTVGAALSGRTIRHFEPTPHPPDEPWDGSLTVTQALPTREQVDAARELYRRCEGFAAHTVAMHGADRRTIENALLATDDVVGLAENVAVHRAPATPDRLRTILASRDPLAITVLDQELAALWLRTSRSPGSSLTSIGRFGTPSPAMRLAGCDLGLDCGPASRTALVGCLDDAQVCGETVVGQWSYRASASERAALDDLRGRIVGAITTGDYAMWGL